MVEAGFAGPAGRGAKGALAALGGALPHHVDGRPPALAGETGAVRGAAVPRPDSQSPRRLRARARRATSPRTSAAWCGMRRTPVGTAPRTWRAAMRCGSSRWPPSALRRSRAARSCAATARRARHRHACGRRTGHRRVPLRAPPVEPRGAGCAHPHVHLPVDPVSRKRRRSRSHRMAAALRRPPHLRRGAPGRLPRLEARPVPGCAFPSAAARRGCADAGAALERGAGGPGQTGGTRLAPDHRSRHRLDAVVLERGRRRVAQLQHGWSTARSRSSPTGRTRTPNSSAACSPNPRCARSARAKPHLSRGAIAFDGALNRTSPAGGPPACSGGLALSALSAFARRRGAHLEPLPRARRARGLHARLLSREERPRRIRQAPRGLPRGLRGRPRRARRQATTSFPRQVREHESAALRALIAGPVPRRPHRPAAGGVHAHGELPRRRPAGARDSGGARPHLHALPSVRRTEAATAHHARNTSAGCASSAHGWRGTTASGRCRSRTARRPSPKVRPAERTSAVPNGVDLARFTPAAEPGDAPEVLYIGSFRHRPNIIGYERLAGAIMPAVWERFPRGAPARGGRSRAGEILDAPAGGGPAHRPARLRGGRAPALCAGRGGGGPAAGFRRHEHQGDGSDGVRQGGGFDAGGMPGSGPRGRARPLVRDDSAAFADAASATCSTTRRALLRWGAQARATVEARFSWDAIAEAALASYAAIAGVRAG